MKIVGRRNDSKSFLGIFDIYFTCVILYAAYFK